MEHRSYRPFGSEYPPPSSPPPFLYFFLNVIACHKRLIYVRKTAPSNYTFVFSYTTVCKMLRWSTRGSQQ